MDHGETCQVRPAQDSDFEDNFDSDDESAASTETKATTARKRAPTAQPNCYTSDEDEDYTPGEHKKAVPKGNGHKVDGRAKKRKSGKCFQAKL